MRGGNKSCLKEISVLANPESIPESIEVDMEEIKAKEKVRLSSLSQNNDYDFPSSLKNQDPVLVSVLQLEVEVLILKMKRSMMLKRVLKQKH